MKATKLKKEFLLESQKLATQLLDMWQNKEVDNAINSHTYVNVSKKIYTVYNNLNKMIEMYESDKEIVFEDENKWDT